MRKTRFDNDPCGMARALDAIGEWWSLLIVREAMLGTTQFDDLHQKLGISRNMLSARLKRLVDAGIFEREPVREGAKRARYVLSAKGHDLWRVVIALRLWGDRWSPSERLQASLVDQRDGSRIVALDARSEAGVMVPGREIVMRRPERAAPVETAIK